MQTKLTTQHSLNIPRNSSKDPTSSFVSPSLYPLARVGIRNLPRRHEVVTEYGQQIQREAMNAPSNVGSSRSVRTFLKQLNSQAVVQSSEGLSITLERLDDLLFEEAEEGFPLPTRYAYRQTHQLLKEAHHYLPTNFPRATVSVEENGGIFVYWIKLSSTVQLTVPFEAGKLLYIRAMQNDLPSRICQNPDGREIARCLLMFNRLS